MVDKEKQHMHLRQFTTQKRYIRKLFVPFTDLVSDELDVYRNVSFVLKVENTIRDQIKYLVIL